MNPQTTVSPVPLLELDNVSIAYQQGNSSQRVVHNVSFTIQPGKSLPWLGSLDRGKPPRPRRLSACWRKMVAWSKGRSGLMAPILRTGHRASWMRCVVRR